MDLIFDLTKEEVKALQKALDILETVSDEIETVACKETDFTDVSVIERQSEEWYSLIERIVIASIDINTLLEEPIFDDNPFLTEKRIDN